MPLTFTEFYCDPVYGSNLNAGAPIGGIYPVRDAGGTGSYTRNGGLTVVNDDLYAAFAGTPFSGCAVGDFISIFDLGDTKSDFVARITAINAGGSSVDISLTAVTGARPVTAGSKCAIVGGAWRGPAGNSFPFDFVGISLKDAAGHLSCINLKNNGIYPLTAAMASVLGTFWGYSVTPRDGGKAIIDGTSLAISGSMFQEIGSSIFADIIFQNQAALLVPSVGSNMVSANTSIYFRCIFRHAQNSGISPGSISGTIIVECEAYDCNKSGALLIKSGFSCTAQTTVIRCISHDNNTPGTTCPGFRNNSGSNVTAFVDCISFGNITDGFASPATSSGVTVCSGCDSYDNGGSGYSLFASSAAVHSPYLIENSDAIKNVAYGMLTDIGEILSFNNTFGAGIQANGSGDISGNVYDIGSFSLPPGQTPWASPGGADFRITNQRNFDAGRGYFTQLAVQAPFVGYPDIGAAKHIVIQPYVSIGGGGPNLTKRPIPKYLPPHQRKKIEDEEKQREEEEARQAAAFKEQQEQIALLEHFGIKDGG